MKQRQLGPYTFTSCFYITSFDRNTLFKDEHESCTRTISISLSSSDVILTEHFLYASQETGSVCRTVTESGRGRILVLLNGNLECPGTYKKLNGYFFVEGELIFVLNESIIWR